MPDFLQSIHTTNEERRNYFIDNVMELVEEDSDYLANFKKFLSEVNPTYRSNELKSINDLYELLLYLDIIPRGDYIPFIGTQFSDFIKKNDLELINEVYSNLTELMILKYRNSEFENYAFDDTKDLKSSIMKKYIEGYNQRNIEEDTTPSSEILKKLSSINNIQYFIETNNLMDKFDIINRN